MSDLHAVWELNSGRGCQERESYNGLRAIGGATDEMWGIKLSSRERTELEILSAPHFAKRLLNAVYTV